MEKIKTKTTYETSDGEVFTDKALTEKYQKELDTFKKKL